MKLIDFNWHPTDRQLRQFGVISLVALPLAGWMWAGNAMVIWGLAVAGALLAGVSYRRPQWLKPIFLGLCMVTLPIGIIVSELALLGIYFGLFVPLGLLFRLLGRDALERSIDRQAGSYWQAKRQPAGPASYFRRW